MIRVLFIFVCFTYFLSFSQEIQPCLRYLESLNNIGNEKAESFLLIDSVLYDEGKNELIDSTFYLFSPNEYLSIHSDLIEYCNSDSLYQILPLLNQAYISKYNGDLNQFRGAWLNSNQELIQNSNCISLENSKYTFKLEFNIPKELSYSGLEQLEYYFLDSKLKKIYFKGLSERGYETHIISILYTESELEPYRSFVRDLKKNMDEFLLNYNIKRI